jgi:hypothetical protein
MKSFFRGMVKLGGALAIAFGLLGFGAWGIIAFREHAEIAANAPLAQPKSWPPPVTPAALNHARFNLKSMWRDGYVYYQLDITDVPIKMTQQCEYKKTATIVLDFLDDAGFKQYEEIVPLSEMTEAAGSSGKTSLAWNASRTQLAENYRHSASWTVQSSGVPLESNANININGKLVLDGLSDSDLMALACGDISRVSDAGLEYLSKQQPDLIPAAPRSNWMDVSAWRSLKRGMSARQVRALLGDPTGVDEDEYLGTTWHYGTNPIKGMVGLKGDHLVSWVEP